MATIIHDPTRGWLLLTEKWPNGTTQDEPLIPTKEWYESAVAHCLSTAIEIDRKDWDEVEILTGCRTSKEMSIIKNHNPYSVDVEFEVTEETMSSADFSEYETYKIARLVKAKDWTVTNQRQC